MALFISPYTIHADHARSSRSLVGPNTGVLIKLEDGGSVGYADCHPHPGLGDANYEAQILALKEGSPTPLMERTLALAKADAEARKNQVSLSPEQAFRNHCLLPFTELLVEGSQQESSVPIKIKLGVSLKDEIYQLNRFSESFKNPLRIDFNATLTKQSYRDFVEALTPAAREHIEFVEEPIPYDKADWEEISGLLPLAIDNEIVKLKPEHDDELPFEYMVIKPALVDPAPWVQLCQRSKIRYLFTHYMDHPVGVRHAVAEATKYMDHPLASSYHGLAPRSWQFRALNSAFTETNYSTWIGAGVGWESLLGGVSWTPL